MVVMTTNTEQLTFGGFLLDYREESSLCCYSYSHVTDQIHP